jgi:hypothetical protein
MASVNQYGTKKEAKKQLCNCSIITKIIYKLFINKNIILKNNMKSTQRKTKKENKLRWVQNAPF